LVGAEEFLVRAEMLASLRSGRATSRQPVDRSRQCATDLNEVIEAAIERRDAESKRSQGRTKMNETEQKTNQTPYSAWLQTEILHTLQQTVSDHPGEYAFLINAQVQELYWALIVKEMQTAQASLREDNLAEAHEALLRVRPETSGRIA
jgi:hypothetical protein